MSPILSQALAALMLCCIVSRERHHAEEARVKRIMQRRRTFQNSIARPTAELAKMMKLVLLSSRYSRITNCTEQAASASAAELHISHRSLRSSCQRHCLCVSQP